jgi:hypothetical protein
MTSAEKKSRIAQKKSLGQPAGKPRRVAPLKRKMQDGGSVSSSGVRRLKQSIKMKKK